MTGVDHCLGNVARWTGWAFRTASVIEPRQETENWNCMPGAEVRRHRVAAKEGTPVINNGPRTSGAYLLGVRVPDRETLLPVQDAVEFEEFLVVVAVVAKK